MYVSSSKSPTYKRLDPSTCKSHHPIMLGVVSFLASVSLAYALVSKGYNNPFLPPRPVGQVISAQHSLKDSVSPVYNFTQYIDHNDHSLGTFQQRYWVTSNFYESGARSDEGSVILN